MFDPIVVRVLIITFTIVFALPTISIGMLIWQKIRTDRERKFMKAQLYFFNELLVYEPEDVTRIKYKNGICFDYGKHGSIITTFSADGETQFLYHFQDNKWQEVVHFCHDRNVISDRDPTMKFTFECQELFQCVLASMKKWELEFLGTATCYVNTNRFGKKRGMTPVCA